MITTEELWECRKCGYENQDESRSCAKCSLDKATATTVNMKRKKYCDDCGHLHLLGFFYISSFFFTTFYPHSPTYSLVFLI
jgi:hypothetical protein